MAQAATVLISCPFWATILWALLCFGTSSCAEYRLTNLLNSCGSNISESEFGLVTAHGFTDSRHPDCELSITVMPGRRLVLSVETAQIRNIHIFTRRCDSYFQILHGPDSANASAPLSRAICSNVRDQKIFHVPAGTVKLLLHSSSSKYTHLRVVYTNVIPAGTCNETTQFKCAASGACISSGLLCDAHNNCGDNSDERQLGRCHDVPYYHVSTTVSLVCGGSVLLFVLINVFYCSQPREPKWYRLTMEKIPTE